MLRDLSTVTRPESISVLTPSWAVVLPAADWPAMIASALCGGKVLCALAGTLLIATRANTGAAIAVALGILFDVCDGVIFKRSELAAIARWRDRRRIYDSLTDRVLLASVALPMVGLGLLPVPFFLLILLREGVTGVTNIVPLWRTGIVFDANDPGRFGLLLIGVQSIMCLAGLSVSPLMYLAVAAASVWSGVLYSIDMKNALR